jgi:hypothetical protein
MASLPETLFMRAQARLSGRGASAEAKHRNHPAFPLRRLLESLRPRAEYLKLFRAVVLDCWNAELKAAHTVVRAFDARIESLEQRIRQFHAAFVVEQSIDSETYRDMVNRLRSEVTVAEIERSEAQRGSRC